MSLLQYQSLCHRNVHDHLPHGAEHHDPHPDLQANPHWAEKKDAPQMRTAYLDHCLHMFTRCKNEQNTADEHLTAQ